MKNLPETESSAQDDPRLEVLPDEPDAFANLVHTNLKKRARLEHIAAKSMWNRTKLRKVPLTFFPFALFWVLFSFQEMLVDYLAFIFVCLIFLIQGLVASIHHRIDAVYELMKMGPPEDHPHANQTERAAGQSAPRPESK